mmetsp:Transcript_48316/g.80016  ORF Transcript_48316/g.80016 Transcript_48316/m.80016 type:complete len:126 (+) Transcript_48316:474-851(+)
MQLLAGDGKIYAVPSRTDKILVIDPLTRTSSFLSSPTFTIASSGGSYATCLAVGGTVIAAPLQQQDFLKISNGAATTISYASQAASYKFRAGVTAADGKAYFLPYGEHSAWVYDNNAGENNRHRH